MIKLAVLLYHREILVNSGRTKTSELYSGIMGTLHKAGNGLNINPHVHLVCTRELVNKNTGEIKRVHFIKYNRFKIEWMKAVCRYLVRSKVITTEESKKIRDKFTNGFHVYFQPIAGDNNDVFYRTAEYLATGFFHNSQIIKVDHKKRKVTFNYRNWVDRCTRKKMYKTITMDIYEFMAKMLYYLPDHHSKNIRYYGIYVQSKREKLAIIEKATWSKAISTALKVNQIYALILEMG
jgi:hypothetical protein